MVRVAEAAHTRPAPAASRWKSRWVALAAAASFAAAFFAGWTELARHAEGERARAEVELALRITSEKLGDVQSKVQARMVAFRDRFQEREQR